MAPNIFGMPKTLPYLEHGARLKGQADEVAQMGLPKFPSSW